MEADPGWGFSWKSIPLVFVPQLAVRRAGRSDRDPLLELRLVFLTLVAAIFTIGVVAFFLGNMNERSDSTGLSVAIVVAVGSASLLAQRVLPRPLDCTSVESLASSYRTRFFLRVAISEAAALAGFCLDIALGPWWIYFIGAGFALIGFSQLAPTVRHLAQDQDSLSLQGCTRSLVEALRLPPISQL
jgi:hypothetical protein